MQVYGIDLSKDKFDVNFINEKGNEKFLEVKNKLLDISRFLSNVTEDTVLVAEYTGTYGDLLVFLCNQYNVKIALIPGYTIKHSLGMPRGKSDPLDARRIREYGLRFFDKLTFKTYQGEKLNELLQLYNLRNQAVKFRKQMLAANHAKSNSPIQSRFAHQRFMSIMGTLDAEILSLEKEMYEVIASDEQLLENYKRITSVKGVGRIIATDLIIKTKNFVDIDTAKRAASYAGICPFPNASGKMVRKSKTSPYADRALKTLLYLGATSAVRYNKEYKLYYQKKALEGKEHFLIMNNICNKIIRTIYAIIRDQSSFNPMHICLDPRENIHQLQ